MDIVKFREHLVLYPSATCNLKCTYCYIDKNPALERIDKILDESFADENYYFDFARKVYPDKNQLKFIEFWGGESSPHLNRTYNTIEKLCGYYPNISNFFMSTNFTYRKEFDDNFFGFVNILNRFPNRRFHFTLQVSIDGPAFITDTNRGPNVTKVVCDHLYDFAKTASNKLQGGNVTVDIQFKATLTSKWINKLIDYQDDADCKKSIIEYYKFFDDIKTKFDSIKFTNELRLCIGVPNTACPGPHTVQDGKDFAKFCRISREIQNEIYTGNNPFTNYQNIMMYQPNGQINYNEVNSYCGYCGGCGSGQSVVGLLPYGYVSCCHNGFVNLIEDYKKESIRRGDDKKDSYLDFRLFMDQSNYFIKTLDEYNEKYQYNVAFNYDNLSSTKLANMALQINMLARAGQVDEQYKDTKEALHGAYYIAAATAFCMRDNVATTGSSVLTPIGLYRLLLNGAREYIEQ